jgi:hypothetical protein
MNAALPEITRLRWLDPDLGALELPGGTLQIRAGFGSGLARRAGDSPGRVWAVCDRGPNIKIGTAIERFGLKGLERVAHLDGAKLMPRLDLGPAIAELQVSEEAVELVRTVRLSTSCGSPLSGLPLSGTEHGRREPALSLNGADLGTHPAGADTEGIAALADGGFWIGDEYGPSLLRHDPEGRLLLRWVPDGSETALLSGICAVEAVLPALASRRQLNRGFEAVALSPDERLLHLAFQSPLAHPDVAAHRRARHVRLWSLDLGSGRLEGQYLYPLDEPESFRRDCARGNFGRSDIKVSEISPVGSESLLVLERGSESAKIYRVTLENAKRLPELHLDLATRPTVEEMSAAGTLDLPVLEKSLLFSTDDAPFVAGDIEGMALLSPTDLLLVTDNDFGVEGAETSFWRLRFAEPIG